MAIAFSSLNYTGPHGLIEEGELLAGLQVYRVPGVVGEVHLTDRLKSLPIRIPAHFLNYGTPTLLQAAIDTFNAVVGTAAANTSIVMTGTITQTVTNCTFLGFVPSRPAMYDGSGVNGWHRSGYFLFTRRAS